jgi:hypothetical protein
MQCKSEFQSTRYTFIFRCILEASQGLSHPNYLKILALWTFLDKKIEKTDEELLALCEMDKSSDIKPVELAHLLQGVTLNGN